MQPSLDEVVAVARLFGNVVIEGPPGTGKTRLVGEVAAAWHRITGRELGGDAQGAWAMTMHPSTGYEDFIEGLRADENGNFVVRKGFLRDRVRLAMDEPEKDFVILLDELNRANVPRVLGDTMLTLERSKRAIWRGGEWTGGLGVTLPYSLEELALPDNLYILATMNTTDRSVTGLDSALRRRFAFVRLPPLDAEEMLDSIEAETAASDQGGEIREALTASAGVLGRLNDDLLGPVLGADHVLGHSYLMLAANEVAAAGVGGGDPLSDEVVALATRLHDSNGARTFWVQVGAGTGELRNQVDLSKVGRSGGPGSIAFFFPGAAVPAGGTVGVDIRWQGEDYSGAELKYYDSEHANGTWRLNLRGEAVSGQKLGGFGRTHFAQHALVFIELAPDSYELHSLPLTAIPTLESWGRYDIARQSTRRYGEITAPSSGDDQTPIVIRRTWQYAILPQLIDLVVSQGAEGLLDPRERHDLLQARRMSGEALAGAEAAAAALENFAAELGLRIRVDGTGLSRTLVVDLVVERTAIDEPEDVEVAEDLAG